MMPIMVLLTTDHTRTPITMIIGLILTPNGPNTKNKKKKGEKEASSTSPVCLNLYVG